MEFKKYSSLDNAYRQKFIDHCHELGINQWVALEKVHGSNFSFITDGYDVTPAKRTSTIGINPENGRYEFYGCHDVVTKYMNSVRQIADIVQGPVVVYGELYGQGIQKEIDYGSKDFIAFDIMLEDGTFIPHDAVVDLCSRVGIPVVPELGRGSLEEMLSISPEINSIVAPGEQTAEGLVIKPLDVDARLGNGSRAIIKNKSKAFSEKKDRTPKKPFKLPDSVKPLFDDFCQYLNENRLNNVLSKIGKVTQKDFGMVTGSLIQDAKDEFERDEYEIAKDDWKLIAKSVGKEASNVVRSQWLNILDKEN